jgi:hypothetical protein
MTDGRHRKEPPAKPVQPRRLHPKWLRELRAWWGGLVNDLRLHYRMTVAPDTVPVPEFVPGAARTADVALAEEWTTNVEPPDEYTRIAGHDRDRGANLVRKVQPGTEAAARQRPQRPARPVGEGHDTGYTRDIPAGFPPRPATTAEDRLREIGAGRPHPPRNERSQS